MLSEKTISRIMDAGGKPVTIGKYVYKMETWLNKEENHDVQVIMRREKSECIFTLYMGING